MGAEPKICSDTHELSLEQEILKPIINPLAIAEVISLHKTIKVRQRKSLSCKLQILLPTCNLHLSQGSLRATNAFLASLCPARHCYRSFGCSSKALFRVTEHQGAWFIVRCMNRSQICRVAVCNACSVLEFIALNYTRGYRVVRERAQNNQGQIRHYVKATVLLSQNDLNLARGLQLWTQPIHSALLHMKLGLFMMEPGRLVCVHECWEIPGYAIIKCLVVNRMWVARGTLEARCVFSPQKATC